MDPQFTIRLGQESDVDTLSSIMTDAFATDAAYSLIWGSAAPGTHEMVATKGLFTPLQKDGQITDVAMDASSKKIVGFATWGLPKERVPEGGKGGGMPDIPGVNMQLFNQKLGASRGAQSRDIDPTKDFSLSYFFVHPAYQRKGVGSLLLQVGIKRADDQQAKIWLTSTPQAVPVYQKSGWEVKEIYTLDLGKHGGTGTYNRAWMVRPPPQTRHEMA